MQAYLSEKREYMKRRQKRTELYDDFNDCYTPDQKEETKILKSLSCYLIFSLLKKKKLNNDQNKGDQR